MSKHWSPWLVFTLSVLLVLPLLNGCESAGNAQVPAAKPAPPEVGVVVVQSQDLAITTELPGRTAPHLIAEVRPQVGGIIQQRLFVEGARVKAGELLYRIDPAGYQAAYDSAAAALARSEARLTPARLKAERFQELIGINAVSQQDYDDATAALKLAQAEVAASKAALQVARINLDYTKVRAPIAGHIGRSLVTTGALVTAGQPTPLATIQKLDPLYVDLTQSSTELLRMKRDLSSGALRDDGMGQTRVKLLLADGSPYPLAGTLKFSDVTVNQSTGSVTLRTLFPNPQQLLLPGMYVRAIVEEGIMKEAILVPQQGVSRDPAGNATALVVGNDDKVEGRKLTIARAIGNQWLVSSGLHNGDRLIVEGVQKARPGSPVRVATLDGGTAATIASK